MQTSAATVAISGFSALNKVRAPRWRSVAAAGLAIGLAAGIFAGSAQAEPAKGGAANLAMVGEPQGLDPMISTADLVGTIMQHVYEPLYTFDANWNVAPMLAEGMPVVSKDGLTYASRSARA